MANHSDCRLCDLCHTATHVGISASGIPSGVMFIGIGPGDTEDARGLPFVGRSGIRLRQLVSKHLSRVPVAYSNLVGCRPAKDKPTTEQADICWRTHGPTYLSDFKPKVLVALGEIVAHHILVRETSALRKLPPIAEARKKIYDYHGIPLLVTYHPAATLRSGKISGGKFLAALENTLAQAKRLCDDPSGGLAPVFTSTVEPPPSAGEVVLDLETTSLRPFTGHITHMGLAPLLNPTQSFIEESDLSGFNFQAPSTIIGWNLPFDSQWLPESVFESEWIDGMVLHGILYPEATERGLKTVGPQHTGIYYQKLLVDCQTLEETRHYLRMDLWQTGVSVNSMREKLKGHPSEKYYFPFMMRLTRSLAQMSRWGCRIDVPLVKRLCAALQIKQWRRLQKLADFAKMCEVHLNIRPGAKDKRYTYHYSKKALTELIYDHLHFPPQRTAKGNLSLGDEARRALEPYDTLGILKVFGEYLSHQKLCQTYLAPYLDENSGWLDKSSFTHSIPNLIKREKDGDSDGIGGGAATGRISWKEPPLQVYMESLKCIVVSRWPNGEIWSVDLSQIEPRLIAWMAEEEILLDTFRTGKDPYVRIMSISLGIDPSEVTDALRQVGKRVFLSILYGAQAFKIVDIFRVWGNLTISAPTAIDLIRRFRLGFPNIISWSEWIRGEVELGRTLVMPTGFARKFPSDADEESMRQAINCFPQHTASAINHAILLESFKLAPIILPIPPTIHDANVFDAQESANPKDLTDVYDDVVGICKRTFGFDLSPVPIKYKLKRGARWK